MTEYLKKLALVLLLALFLGACSEDGGSMDITGEDTGDAAEETGDNDQDSDDKDD
jgi:PBP1b-binding outer membrane lipoprotein LpoB